MSVDEFYITNLTELGLDHLTLDELKQQRPDLFVYQPYHETETRYGIILNDGRVAQLMDLTRLKTFGSQMG